MGDIQVEIIEAVVIGFRQAIVKEKQDLPDQVASSEMQVYEALRRRGVALEFANLLTWQEHERYVPTLFSRHRKDPLDGYAKVSLQQVLRADRAARTRLIEANTPIRRDAAGHLPLDTELIRALEVYDVALNLVPLPKAAVPTLVKSDLKEHKQTYHSDKNQ